RTLVGAANMVEGLGVHVPVNPIRIETHVLHDVDLATRRPADLVDVGAEHPDGWPHTAPRGQLSPHFDTAVPPARLPLRGEARRRVLRFPEALAPGLDDEITILEPRVLGTTPGVVLQLLVANEALLVSPARGVG